MIDYPEERDTEHPTVTEASASSVQEINKESPSDKPLTLTYSNFDTSNIPDETKQFLKLACDPNLKLVEIDSMMGWVRGHGLSLLRRYPILKQVVDEGRILAMREVGIEKSSAYEVYRDGLKATGVTKEGVEFEDHRTRIMAADRVLTLLGESPVKPTVEIRQNVTAVKVEQMNLVYEAVRKLDKSPEGG